MVNKQIQFLFSFIKSDIEYFLIQMSSGSIFHSPFTVSKPMIETKKRVSWNWLRGVMIYTIQNDAIKNKLLKQIGIWFEFQVPMTITYFMTIEDNPKIGFEENMFYRFLTIVI